MRATRDGAGEEDRGRAFSAAERANLARCVSPPTSREKLVTSSRACAGPFWRAATRALSAENLATRALSAEKWRLRSAVAAFCASNVPNKEAMSMAN